MVLDEKEKEAKDEEQQRTVLSKQIGLKEDMTKMNKAQVY